MLLTGCVKNPYGYLLTDIDAMMSDYAHLDDKDETGNKQPAIAAPLKPMKLPWAEARFCLLQRTWQTRG